MFAGFWPKFAGILPEFHFHITLFKQILEPEFREFAQCCQIQNLAVTADKLQPTLDHMPNAALLASSSARPAAALRDKASPWRDARRPAAARTGVRWVVSGVLLPFKEHTARPTRPPRISEKARNEKILTLLSQRFCTASRLRCALILECAG